MRIDDRAQERHRIAGSDPSAAGTFDMTPTMFQTMMVSIVVFSILFIDLVWHRIRLGKLANQVEELKFKKEELKAKLEDDIAKFLKART